MSDDVKTQEEPNPLAKIALGWDIWKWIAGTAVVVVGAVGSEHMAIHDQAITQTAIIKRLDDSERSTASNTSRIVAVESRQVLTDNTVKTMADNIKDIKDQVTTYLRK